MGDPNRALVLLDTEGLDDPKKGSKTHDMNLFTLAVLLSSLLVYNTVGTIDDSSIDRLEYAARISDHIKVSSEEEIAGADLAQHFPGFIWAVRDHHLVLELSDGRAVSPKEYLEDRLKCKPGRSMVCHQLIDALKRSFIFMLHIGSDPVQHDQGSHQGLLPRAQLLRFPSAGG